MRTWVIGSDPLARALGRSWAQAGHEVLFTFSFDGTDWDTVAAETGGRVGTLAEGAAAEVVLLAVPWGRWARCSGPRGRWRARWCWTRPTRPTPCWGSRGPRRWPSGRRGRGWSRAFNTVAAPVVAQAAAAPGRLSLLYCGDHAAAKRVAAGLVVAAGFVPVDVGRLEVAREVEALGRLLADLAYGRGPGPVGYQLLTPAELSATGG